MAGIGAYTPVEEHLQEAAELATPKAWELPRRLTLDLTAEAVELRAGMRLRHDWTGAAYVRREDGDTTAGVRFERRW